ncbi:protein CYSTEINE-RICH TRANSMEMBRANE MODULE 9-like [Aristolochia californica]|uniref:protein CYSTEINE-RICH TRANSMEMBRANE MODULE 9-like n=1 Tax=Aristolochia californica TaxID=171875 RepID=UPI0035D71535
MSYDQHQAPVYPPPTTAYPPPAQGYPPQSYPAEGYPQYVAPPPAGYPMKEGTAYPQQPVETRDRGDGFWKGCCAALCCCCVLDACF